MRLYPVSNAPGGRCRESTRPGSEARPRPDLVARLMIGILATIAVPLWLGLTLGESAAEVARESTAARGIAVLGSSIGNEYPVEALAAFVQRAGFSPVIIDWAYITVHWERTDFAGVNRLAEILSTAGVEVAAMYRPRFLGEATVPFQMTRDGESVTSHGREICFASEEARRWGISWGEKILERCPGFAEIIIYNPRNLCQCPDCRTAQKVDPFAHYTATWRFLREARTAWQVLKPEVKLGVVFGPDPDFWARGEQVVDVARPFLLVTEEADIRHNVAAVGAVRDLLPGRTGAALAKVTWGPEDKVSAAKLAEFDRLTRETGTGYFLWMFDTLFLSDLYDPRTVAEALGLDWATLREPLGAMATKRYTEEQIQATDAAIFFEGLARPPNGYHPFASLWALTKKARMGNVATKKEIADRAIEIIRDPTQLINGRWQCCYLLATIEGERAVAELARVLREDESEVVRGVAACALGRFDTPEALAALEQGAEDEQSEAVLDWIHRALRGEFRPLLAPVMSPDVKAEGVSLADALEGKGVTLVLVKDFMRLENSGADLHEVEFERYFPAVDGEQIVVGRWVDARTDAGQVIPASVVKVIPDQQGNLIHTWRLSTFPASQQASVIITSLVARRERPQPEGGFVIPEPEQYPPEVQPFLRATAMVARDHAEVRRQAQELLAGTQDAYQVAQQLVHIMREKSYEPKKDADYSLPTAASVLRYGGSCCGSAVAAAAVLRACGIPTQITYVPAGYIHGIVQFYLNGYGWVRMDATCEYAKLPFVQEEADLGKVRLFDMPIEMEAIWHAYAWPYHHANATSAYKFRAAGQECQFLRFPLEAPISSANQVLGSMPLEGAWEDWDALVAASRAEIANGTLGEFQSVTEKLPGLSKYVAFLR